MIRNDAIKLIMSCINNEFVVCNIGHPSQELFAINNRNRNFYMLGSMGLASSIGLGVALSTSHNVVTIEGDGAMLMNLGSLATIAANCPSNYILIIIDNQAYGSTGFQPTFTSHVDLAAVAKACGIQNSICVTTAAEITKAVNNALYEQTGPSCIVIKTERGCADGLQAIPLNAGQIKQRFMKELENENNRSKQSLQ